MITAKLSQEKKEERIAKEKQKLAEIDIQQDNLTYLSEGIDKMGSEIILISSHLKQ